MFLEKLRKNDSTDLLTCPPRVSPLGSGEVLTVQTVAVELDAILNKPVIVPGNCTPSRLVVDLFGLLEFALPTLRLGSLVTYRFALPHDRVVFR